MYAPARSILDTRWRRLFSEADPDARQALFKETRDSRLDDRKDALPGKDTASPTGSLSSERGSAPAVIQVGYRSFDRQWLVADHRVIDQPRRALWSARIPGQVFILEQHSKAISDGPGVVLSSLIPDMDAFNNRGGRTAPSLHPGGRANTAPGLLHALYVLVGGNVFEGSVSVDDLVAYVAAVVAHPGYTSRFTDELTTPGIRVPLTADPTLWAEAVGLGRSIVWAQTYGEVMADPEAGRLAHDIRFPVGDPNRILNLSAVTAMPAGITYDETSQRVQLGSGEWGPVRREVFDYVVGGKNVLRSWVNYRKATPGGKKTSPLDSIHVDSWPAEWSTELTDLLTLLTRLVSVEPVQQHLLDRVLVGPLLTMATLSEHDVRWPQQAADRKPDFTAPVHVEPATVDRLF